MRKLALLVATFTAFMIAPAVSNAAITDVLDGDLTYGVVTTEGNVSTSLGQRWCGSKPASITSTMTPGLPSDRSTHVTFDGVPLDVNVAFPPASGGDTDWPVVGMFHGYGGSKMTLSAMQRWLDKGYAVYSVTNRGSGESCKSAGSIAADPTGCANGYVHLMDPRFEIRDTQNFLGELVDEGVISPTRIAATGGSYGGSESMHLAILKNRVVNPDGTYHPWQSPLGENMSIAVATPNVPWTDLIQALAPNGDTLDYLEDGSFNGNVGVMKQSFVQGLYISARNAPIGTDPSADLAGWKTLLDAGEPYGTPQGDAMVEEIKSHHSSYYDDHSQAPAPLLISNGFTDDLFPVDEQLRFYNRTRAQYPNTPMAIFNGSFGHQRGQTQSNVINALGALEEKWVDFYLKDIGSQPASDATAYTQTCPNGSAGAGPFTAPNWASIAPGEIKKSYDGTQTIEPNGGSAVVSSGFNPLIATACSTASSDKEPGSASYDIDPAASAYTVLGSATVIAKFNGGSPDSQISARLLDLDGAGNETLISRGSWRPAATGNFQVFQLHPGAWQVAPGHSVRLQLLPKDSADTPAFPLSNYTRPSNNQQTITVDKLELRVPVTDVAGAIGGLVTAPEKKVLPDRAGAELAPGYESIGSETLAQYASTDEPVAVVGALRLIGAPKIKGKRMTVKVKCDVGNDSCSKTTLAFKGAPKKGKKGKNLLIAKGKAGGVAPGKTKSVKLKLTNGARKFFKDRKVRKKGKKKTVKGAKSLRAKVIVDGKRAGFKTVKRVGRVK